MRQHFDDDVTGSDNFGRRGHAKEGDIPICAKEFHGGSQWIFGASQIDK
jgi:hypothetical protein